MREPRKSVYSLVIIVLLFNTLYFSTFYGFQAKRDQVINNCKIDSKQINNRLTSCYYEEQQESNILLSKTDYRIDKVSAPLRYNRTTALPLPEIVVWGQDSASTDLNGIIYDDAIHHSIDNAIFEYDDNSVNPDIAWGDLDGDGLLEMFLVSTDGDGDDLNAWMFNDYFTGYDRFAISNNDDNYEMPTVVCGDFDQKWHDEVFIAVWDYISHNITMYMWRFNFSPDRSSINSVDRLLAESIFAGYTVESLDSATGDFDGDGILEIVVTFTSLYVYDFKAWIIDYQMGDFVISYSWDEKDFDACGFKTATGDVDGDFRDEIVFLGYDSTDFDRDLEGWLFDDALNNYQQLHRWDNNDNSQNADVDLGDVDADGKDEIVFFSTDWDGHDMNLWLWDDADADYAELANSNIDDNLGKGEVVCGDLDLNGVDEIIIASEIADGPDQLYHKIVTCFYEYDGSSLELLGGYKTDRRTANPVLALADVHQDGVVLEYVGESTPATSITDPEIMVVIAAPPSIKNINQNYGSCCSFFGEEGTSSETESKSVSITSAVTLSWEAEFIPDIFSTRLSITLSHALATEISSTKTVARATYYSISDKNGIIFAKTDVSHYDYQINSHPTNASAIGDIVKINVPTCSSLFKWDLDYFEEQYPGYHLQERVFSHILGDASTYPSFTDYNTIVSQPYWYTDPLAVGQGTGSITASITVSESLTESQSRTLSTSIAYGVSVCGWGISASCTYSSTTAYAITIGESLYYRGTVGDIHEDDYDEYKYNFGFVVYAFEDTDLNMVYQVINYWTEGAKTPPDDATSQESSDSLNNQSTSPSTDALGFPSVYLLVAVTVIVLGLVVIKKKKNE